MPAGLLWCDFLHVDTLAISEIFWFFNCAFGLSIIIFSFLPNVYRVIDYICIKIQNTVLCGWFARSISLTPFESHLAHTLTAGTSHLLLSLCLSCTPENLPHAFFIWQSTYLLPSWNKCCCDSFIIGANINIAGITLLNSNITYAIHPPWVLQRAGMGLTQGKFWLFKTIVGTCCIHYQHMTSLAFYYWSEECWYLHRLYTLFYQIIKYDSLYLSSPSILYNSRWVSIRNHSLDLVEIELC